MLDESMRLLAGLQESQIVKNPLPQLFEDERLIVLKEKQRIENEHQSVLNNFEKFQQKMEYYKEMIDNVSALFEKKHVTEFMSGLYESKYVCLRQFADIVINDDMKTTIAYMEHHYETINKELSTIIKLTESVDEENGTTYFVVKTLITNDTDHLLNIPVFKYKTLEEKINNEIPYGAEIIYLTENLSIIRSEGRRTYTRLTSSQLSMLETKGFLI